ncbi:MAG: hypothetical protein U5R30_04230 [Deltaproteobacteria bacterium]|nr:hypothetical protein [Deltaproteobacteria bacterium]
MINAIGEAIAQQTTRGSFTSAVNGREVALQKEMQARRERPVEKTDNSQGLSGQPSNEDNTDTTTRQRVEEGIIVLEKYDRRGKLVQKIPPGYVPFGEIA